jgi:hypothetical protein
MENPIHRIENVKILIALNDPLLIKRDVAAVKKAITNIGKRIR